MPFAHTSSVALAALALAAPAMAHIVSYCAHSPCISDTDHSRLALQAIWHPSVYGFDVSGAAIPITMWRGK